MRWSVTFAVFRRELRDVLRDRRTLFTMLVVPVLLYPALVLGFGKLTQSRSEALLERKIPVLLLVDELPMQPGSIAPPEPLIERLFAVERFRFQAAADPEEAVRDGTARLALSIPGDLDARLARGEEVSLAPVYRSSDEEAQAALTTVRSLVADYRSERWPLVIDAASGDLATAEERGGRLFGGMVAMMVILMAMTGAFYPALDLGAGEKERGTLETLLLSPASRMELVFGKYLTILAVAVVAALVNLGSMTFTFGSFSAMLEQASGGLSIAIPPAAFLVMLVGLLLVAALFSSICLALSSFARTYKEGQAWLTPALLVTMPLSMVALLPDTELDTTFALVPIANLALLMKGLLVGQVEPRAVVLTFVVLSATALAALKWTTRLYEREDVLFREGPPRFGLRPPPGVDLKDRLTVGRAFLLLALAFAWLFFAGTLVLKDPVSGATIQFLGLTFLPIVLVRLSLTRLDLGLLLRRPSPQAVLAGALIGLLGIAQSIGMGGVQSFFIEPQAAEKAAEMLELLMRPLAESPLLVGLLVIAILPGISEELLFRGALLRALDGARGRRILAVVLSSVLFGLFHADLARFFPQALLGLMLALLTLRTASVWPAAIAHAVHNGVIFVLNRDALKAGQEAREGMGEQDLAEYWWLVIPAALGILAVLRVTPQASEEDDQRS